METWFLNHVLGVSLSVLLLGLPGPLRAWTPNNNSTDPVTAGFYSSAATDELSDMGNNETSTSYSSESLSPSQRNILLTHTAETHTAATAGSSGKICQACQDKCNTLHWKLAQFDEFTHIISYDNVFPLQSKGSVNVYFSFLPYWISFSWRIGYNRNTTAKLLYGENKVGYLSILCRIAILS